jgi:hypothetical protein
MAARIRKEIEHDKVVFGAKDDKVLFVFALKYPAKDATRLAVRRCNVPVPPGTPYVFHRIKIQHKFWGSTERSCGKQNDDYEKREGQGGKREHPFEVEIP